jgi:hypothetical protein
VLAVQLVDVAWAGLLLAGVERVRIDPTLPSNPLDLVYMPYTHGLPATFAWTAAAFVAGRRWLGESRAALALAAAVGSHWLLDLVVHRPDLPLWDDAHKVGLALWNLPLAAFLLEAGLLVAGAALLLRSPGASRLSRRGLLWLTGALLIGHVVFWLGPPPPGVGTLALTALAFFLVAAWGAARVEPSPA